MELAQLKILVSLGESENLEFKSSTGSLSSGMQTVCAFLNSKQGGTVIFGIKDNGLIVGQEITDKTRKEVALELNKIEPYAKIDITYVMVQDARQVIVFQVHGNDDKAPYTYDGRPFMRNQSTTMRMPKEEYLYLYNQNNQPLWESLTNNNCTLEDLDHNRIQEVIRMGVFAKRLPESAIAASVPDFLTKMKLMVDNKITNAAVVLFCKNEDKQFMQCRIQLARFKGFDKKEFLDTKMYVGNAFDLYDKSMDFLHFCLPVAARIEPGNVTRVETPAIPYNVLREALTNAFIHRDYSFAGGAITVAVYDDRINITNVGALPKGVVLQQLLIEHTSIQRNPLIAHIFYVCGKIEKNGRVRRSLSETLHFFDACGEVAGRGTLDMIEDCNKIGNPIPEYKEIGGAFSITLYFKESIRSVRMQ